MAPTTHSAHQQHIDAYDRAAHRAKRVKVHHNSSPEPSTISEDSALIPTSVPDEEYTDDSEFDSDISSELSESSDEPSDDSSDEEDSEAKNATTPGTEAVVNLRANRGKKPVMRLHKGEVGEDIRPFLKDFLPKLKAANEELEAQRRAGTLERVEMEEKADVAMEDEDDGEEQYIELNLGLGVLEAKEPNANDGEDGDVAAAVGREDDQLSNEDILGKLMGQEKTEAATGIQVLGEREGT